MSDNNNNNKYHIPSELRISKQWDAAIEQTLVNTAIGATAAGLASIVLFRKSLPFSFSSLFLVY